MKLPLFAELISKFKNKNIEAPKQANRSSNFQDTAEGVFQFIKETSSIEKYPELKKVLEEEFSEFREKTTETTTFNNITLQQKIEINHDDDGMEVSSLKHVEYELQLDNYDAKINLRTNGIGANGSFSLELQTKNGNNFIKISATFMGNEIKGVYDENHNNVNVELAKEVIHNDLFYNLNQYTNGLNQAISEIKFKNENQQKNINNEIQHDIETTIQKIKMRL